MTLQEKITDAICRGGSTNELLGLLLELQLTLVAGSSESNPPPTLNVVDSSSGPAANAAEVTPSDATVIANCRSVFVGTGGDLVVTIGGNVVTFANVPSGTWMPIIVTKVMAATDADDIVVVW